MKSMRSLSSIVILAGMISVLLGGCGGSNDAVEPFLTGEEIKHGTVERTDAATITFASDQHVFRFDGVSSRTFTKCNGTVCGVSPVAAGLDGALARAHSNPQFDFGTSHFSARLEDSLELKPQTGPAGDIRLVEGFGLRAGERAFRAKFYGAWLVDGAFFVNQTILTVRDERGQGIGLGTVFDASALGMANMAAPTSVRGLSGSWKGMMIGVDVSDEVTRGQFIRGNATLVIDDFTSPNVDITFNAFQDLETGAMLEGKIMPSWQNISVDGGVFGDKPTGSDDYIQGHFVGENHAGVVGVFERDSIVGSFGANRQSGGS